MSRLPGSLISTVVLAARDRVWRPVILPLIEAFIDWRWNVDTKGIIEPPQDHPDALYRHAVRYQATPPWILGAMLKEIRADLSGFQFIDIGCGKGRVLVQATRYHFKKLVGIEFIPELAAAARANLKAFQKSGRVAGEAEILCCNAAEYRLPEDDCIVFMYNPFDEAIMEPVVRNIGALATSGRRCFVLYVNPRLEHCFLAGAASFRLIRKARTYSVYELCAARPA